MMRSAPVRLILRYILTLGTLWLITHFLPQYLEIHGNRMAFPTIAALILLLNTFVRPVLHMLALPLKLFMTIAAIVLVNAAFLWLTERIVEQMDPATAVVVLQGGLGGWIVVALLLGLSQWVMSHIVR